MSPTGPEAGELPVFENVEFGGGVLSGLAIGGANVIRPWGVEFADSSAFYSLEDGVGYRYELLEHEERTTGSRHEVTQIIRMKEGLVRLELDECMESTRSIRRSCRLSCLEATLLMDFVLRYRFEASSFPFGSIADHVLPYTASRVHHQFPVDRAAVGNERFSLRVSVVDAAVPAAMGGNVYLRDEEGAWVLHVRMVPVRWEKEVIKLCSKWFGTRPLPQWVSRPLLMVPALRAALWYRGERRPYRNRIAALFSPSAFAVPALPKGETLSWEALCEVAAPFPTTAVLSTGGGFARREGPPCP